MLTKSPELTAILRKCASNNQAQALEAQLAFASILSAALSYPDLDENYSQAETIRQAVLVGDIVRPLYKQTIVSPSKPYIEMPLDLVAPGEEDNYNAYAQPGTGMIPSRSIEGDFVRIPTYKLANSIDWDLQFSENADYNILTRVMELYYAGFTKKMNDDGMSVLIAAAADRNVLIYDSAASAGQFTKRLLSLAKVAMRRNGGGNSASIKRSQLTDVLGSPEMGDDVRNWGIDQLDDTSRREIYIASDGGSAVGNIFGINLHEIDEFGEGQVYQQFYTEVLGATLISGDVEFALGLDLLNGRRDSFEMPVIQEVQVFNDNLRHREQKQGIYGFARIGFGVLDSRRVIGLSF